MASLPQCLQVSHACSRVADVNSLLPLPRWGPLHVTSGQVIISAMSHNYYLPHETCKLTRKRTSSVPRGTISPALGHHYCLRAASASASGIGIGKRHRQHGSVFENSSGCWSWSRSAELTSRQIMTYAHDDAPVSPSCCVPGCTGAGAAIARRFAKEGYKVALVSRRMETLSPVQEEIKAAGHEALSVPCDTGGMT